VNIAGKHIAWITMLIACPGRRMDISLPLGALALSGVVMPFTGIASQGMG